MGKEFITHSLKIDLFFQRLVKEHMFFIEISLPSINKGEIAQANILKKSFEELLAETVIFSNYALCEEFLEANIIVTPFTLEAEEITSKLTGGKINTNITKAELELETDSDFNYTPWLEEKIWSINNRTLNLLEEVISFTEELYGKMVNCEKFVFLYPSLIKHTEYETKLYRDKLNCLQDKKIPKKSICHILDFWNHIMSDHTKFIDGLLDPSEVELKKIAEKCAKTFDTILEKGCTEDNVEEVLKNSIRATKAVIEFKKSSTEKLIQCEVKSIIAPLLGDHVLREANYYFKVLNEIKE